MAISIDTTVHPQKPLIKFGNAVAKIVEITWDDDYEDDGEAFTPNLVGMSEFFFVQAEGIVDDSNDQAFTVEYDYTNEVLRVFEAGADGDGLDELEDQNAALNNLTSRVFVIGVL